MAVDLDDVFIGIRSNNRLFADSNGDLAAADVVNGSFPKRSTGLTDRIGDHFKMHTETFDRSTPCKAQFVAARVKIESEMKVMNNMAEFGVQKGAFARGNFVEETV